MGLPPYLASTSSLRGNYLTGRSTWTPTAAMPSAFYWPLLVPCAPSGLRRQLTSSLGPSKWEQQLIERRQKKTTQSIKHNYWKNMKVAKYIFITLCLSACASTGVRQIDLDSWIGQPVVALETHPVFLTMTAVKTVASDGTQIWNYVNGANLGGCTGGGSVYRNTIDYASYSKFSQCMQRFAACNNIFYIKNGVVQRYAPIGTGGARCYTNESAQPHFRGSANIN